jgi:alkanesulfonate monooxygenase SsuD/methylene tetrahydromethanopterin reductase-like flavin-dependent oxidoreductase (luciferase family)
MATTVDIISEGRLIFGIGAGWHEQEFEGFMGRFPSVKERMTGLEETVQICRGMFRNERTSFSGKLYHVDDVLNSPLPVQKSIPIMVGGGGEMRTLRIAARYADISHFAFNPSEEDLNQKLIILRRHCEAVKRDFDEIRKGISMTPIIGFTKEEIEAKIRQRAERTGIALDEYKKSLGPNVGTPEQCVQEMQKYIDKGVSLFTMRFLNLDDARLFAEEIMGKLR